MARDAFFSRYDSLDAYLTSEAFLETLSDTFRLQDEQSALRFQSLLYQIDENPFHEGFFRQGDRWYFVRDEFFGELELWVLDVNGEGSVLSIEHLYGVEMELPESRGGLDSYDLELRAASSRSLTPLERLWISTDLQKDLEYTLEVEPVSGKELSSIWQGDWSRLSISTEEKDMEGYTYTSTTSALAYTLEDQVYTFGYLPDALGAPEVVSSMAEGFLLADEASALLFESALDLLLADQAEQTSHFQRSGSWYFIRGQWFDDLEGVVIELDPQGQISYVYYDYYIPSEAEEIEEEPYFDESLVDWSLLLLEPAAQELSLVEGQGLSVAFEFDSYAAEQLGAWILTMIDDEPYGMNYSSSGLYSPYYDWIDSTYLSAGVYTVSYLLMKPGMDTQAPLSRLDLTVTVSPFDPPEELWEMRLLSPDSSNIKAPGGQSVPLKVAFDAEAARTYGVALAISHQGEIVGGQDSLYLESPFETTVPGEVLTQGTHLVELMLVSPDRTRVLSSCPVSIEVE